jgi:hypothetical protein
MRQGQKITYKSRYGNLNQHAVPSFVASAPFPEPYPWPGASACCMFAGYEIKGPHVPGG